jgi:hypothetical protein
MVADIDNSQKPKLGCSYNGLNLVSIPDYAVYRKVNHPLGFQEIVAVGMEVRK